MNMFRRILVANRAEIALRVVRACRTLGVPCVAVYSDADRHAPHVREADRALRIGPPAPAESYLSIPALIAAAKEAGCDAVHPGYGFLSERPDFARAVARAGMTFIGPDPNTMLRMSDKLGARRLMHEAGIPVAPGSLEASGDPKVLARSAKEAGYPVMLKAAKGGGGRGIRRIGSEKDLLRAVPLASAEAEKAFGAGALYVEKAISPARHVEVQVLGLADGTVLHFGERECSMQRRHQKVLEETPSPALDAKTRQALWQAAVKGAKAIGYRNAGTMEFLLDADGRFFFMELNQRLQVEHPVTELVTGIDLVHAQIRVAAGKDPGFRQVDILPRGHAVEVRLCAENPDARFLPSTGRIGSLSLPAGPFVRVDSGVEAGQEVTLHYDSLLAKICAWGTTRIEALDRLTVALEECRVEGVRTGIPALLRILEHPGFRKGRYDTGTLEEVMASPRKFHAELLRAAAEAAARAEHARRNAALLPPAEGNAWGAAARESARRTFKS